MDIVHEFVFFVFDNVPAVFLNFLLTNHKRFFDFYITLFFSFIIIVVTSLYKNPIGGIRTHDHVFRIELKKFCAADNLKV